MKANVTQILVFYDAPELVLAETTKARKYLCLTIECDEKETKALCVPVAENKLDLLLQGKIDLRSLFTTPRVSRWYLTDLSKGKRIPLRKFAESRWDIPDDWLPNFDYYLEKGAEPSGKTVVSIAIGQRWELRDLQRFSHKYEEVYALLYSALHDRSDNALTYKAYPWRRGLSSVLFYDDLQANVPRTSRPVVESINYNSPGSIALTVLADVNAQMREMLASVIDDPKTASEAYREIHEELAKRKLLGENPLRTLTLKHDDYLKDSLRRLGAAIGFRHIKRLTSYADDPLRALKILLSLFRRLMAMREYVEDQKVDFKKSFQ